MSDLPNGWAPAKLNQVAIPDRPRELPRDHPNLPFIGMEHIEAHSMRLLGTVPASELKSSAVHFQADDVLYGRLRPYLNKVHLAQFEGLCSAEFIVFAKRKDLNSSWLAYRLNSTDFVSFASSLNAGDRPRVDFDQIGEFDLLVAPRDEQDRIVDELEKQFSRLDAATAALKRVQANLKRYRASVLKAACEGRLVPTEAELARKEGREYEPADKLLERILRERRARWEADTLAKLIASGKSPKDDGWKRKYKDPAAPIVNGLPELPEGWCWVSVEALASKVVDGVHKKPDYVEDGIPFITVRNLTAGPGISFKTTKFVTAGDHHEFTKRANPELGDVLISKDGTLGTVRAVRTEIPFSIFVSVAMIKPVLRQLSDYIEVALMSPQVQAQMVPKGSGLQHIHLEDLREDCIPLPPLAEQERILAETSRRLSFIESIDGQANRNLRRGSSLRSSLLRASFSGQLVPQDPTDEPASVLLERIRAERRAAVPKTSERRPKQGILNA